MSLFIPHGGVTCIVQVLPALAFRTMEARERSTSIVARLIIFFVLCREINLYTDLTPRGFSMSLDGLSYETEGHYSSVVTSGFQLFFLQMMQTCSPHGAMIFSFLLSSSQASWRFQGWESAPPIVRKRWFALSRLEVRGSLNCLKWRKMDRDIERHL